MTSAPTLVAGRYRLTELLGQGGMGRVWLARDVVLDRDVAVKEINLPAELIEADRDAAQRRTLREARAAARLNHPNVAQVYDVFQANGRTWIVMEYVPSRSLQKVLDADGPLEPKLVAGIGLQVLAALEAAHRAGVRHRDVKPGNVLLGTDGRVVLTDFGIATMDGDSIITSSDLLIGSPRYMSPERARNGAALPASDLWSLGATLYAAVEGRPPFDRESAIGMLTALATEPPDPTRRAGPLAPVLEGLLRKDPDERIDAAEARRRLETAAAGRAATVPPAQRDRDTKTQVVPPPVRPPGRTVAAAPEAEPAPGRNNRRLLLVATVVLLLVAGGLAVWFANRSGAGSGTAHGTRTPGTASTTSGTGTGTGGTGTTGTGTGTTGTVSPPRATTSPPGAAPATTGRRPASTAPGRPALPAGWRVYRDPTGFSVYVPAGWTRSKEGSIVYFRDGRGHILGFDQTDQPKPDPVADWRNQSQYRVNRGDFPGYQEIKIVAVPYFRKAADWEYTYNATSGRVHVNNRGFIVSSSKAYGIYWRTPDAEWSARRSDLQLVFDSFRPANG